MTHIHTHSHGRDHAHRHGAASPHPAQPPSWSIFRMTALERVGIALAASACLWAMVLLVAK